MRPSSCSILSTAAATTALASCGAVARATLTIDLRATHASGGAGVVNEKLVDLSDASPGAVITFDIFAVITGQNANPDDEGYLQTFGSLLTEPFGVRGHLRAVVNPNYRQSGFSNGTVQDLDADGDLDVGSNNNAAAVNYFTPRGYGGPSPVYGSIHNVGTLTMTLTEIPGALFSTAVNYRPRIANTAGSWFEDGSATGTAQQGPSAIQVGAPVLLSDVPEPAALGLVGASVTGLLARCGARRRA
jgi:hypothetical protein